MIPSDLMTERDLMAEHEAAEQVSGDGTPDIDVVLVTGLSGAGRGTAAKVLEDLGWYVADNLPPELIARMVDLGLAAGSRITQLAVVMDVRSRGFSGDLDLVRTDLGKRGINPRVVFLESSDDVLVRRYENNRRSHPFRATRPWPKESPRSGRCSRPCGLAQI